MATTNVSYGAVTAMTITLASLSAGTTTGRASTAVSNTVTLTLDYFISGKITTGTSPTVNKYITVYFGASDSTLFSANATGTDGTVTFAGEDSQLVRALSIPIDGTSNHTYEFAGISLCQTMNLMAPPRSFFVVVVNDSDVNLNGTGSNHSISYHTVGITST